METKDFADCKEEKIIEIEYTCGSDYSGDTVTKSNFQALQEELKDEPGVYELCGWYSGYGIGYIESELTHEGLEKIKDIDNRLESYPSLDDDRLSELEMEIKYEYWHDDAKNYLKEYLSDDEELSDLGDAFLQTAQEIFEQNTIIETGCIPYCHSGRFAKDMAKKYPINEIFKNLDYSITRIKRQSSTLYKIVTGKSSFGDFLIVNDGYISTHTISIVTLKQYMDNGLLDFIANDSVKGEK